MLILLCLISAVGVRGRINPMIGTDLTGHTYPGATYPFGMIQLSPSAGIDDWKHAGDYHYTDSTVKYFSHTHISGPGLGDYDDLGITPSVHPLPLDHANEVTEAGYYRLDTPQVRSELTVSRRAGYHRYTFTATPIIVIHLTPRGRTVQSPTFYQDGTVIYGSYISVNNAFRTRSHFNFAIVVNTTFTVTSHHPHYTLTFDPNITTVELQVGISSVSPDNAYLNVVSQPLTFEHARETTKHRWDTVLSKFGISNNNITRDVYHTAIYHSYLHPHLFSDINGQHRGPDHNVHTTDFDYYTLFSTWDTFRSWGTLIALSEPDIYTDMMRSLLHFSTVKHHLPVWTYWDQESECMVGIHSITLLGIATSVGISLNQTQIDSALEATLTRRWRQLDQFTTRGWVSSVHHQSASENLENSYNFDVASRLTSNCTLSQQWREYGTNYRHIWDGHFFRGKNEHGFTPLKNYANWNGDYAEAIPEDMVWFVPHNLTDLISLHGGIANMTARLYNYFFVSSRSDNLQDNTGLIHMHAHGNENGHHAMYLFNYLGRYDLTVDVVNQIYKLYEPTLPGNDDAGQLSAWYVLSGFGFHPIDPTSGRLELGVPLFPSMVWGNLYITRDCPIPTCVYFNQVKINFLTVAQVRTGGHLHFRCGD